MILGQAGDDLLVVRNSRLTKHKKSLKRIKKRKTFRACLQVFLFFMLFLAGSVELCGMFNEML